ncbi:phasin family protein [Sphingomonas soli]|uniref:phasin family protein n=1 Tax=Sphingomonas soli TaxID=266127 RepID=UPI00083470AF|nr:phasin family protein [Sphingomonas soli]
MASKGPKNGTVKTAASKPAARRKPTAPKAIVAAPVAEKPVQAAPVEPVIATPVAEAVAETLPETVPVVEAAPQEVIETVTETTESVEAVIEPVLEAIAEIAAPVTEKVETMIETNTAKAQALFADFNDRTKAAVEKSTKLIEEANDFAKGNVEAIVESGKIAAKGLETLGQDAADYGRKSFESTTAALKTFATVKSPAELFKLQSDFFRTAFDSYVAEASKNTEAFIKLAGDTVQPLSSRFAVAAEKVKAAA